MSSLNDLLSSAQNIASALNGWITIYRDVNGALNAAGLTSATLVRPGAGRIASVSVIVAGSADGMIYDANSASATTNPIYVIPQTVGVFVVNFPVSNGVVVVPGTGQTVSVSYS